MHTIGVSCLGVLKRVNPINARWSALPTYLPSGYRGSLDQHVYSGSACLLFHQLDDPARHLSDQPRSWPVESEVRSLNEPRSVYGCLQTRRSMELNLRLVNQVVVDSHEVINCVTQGRKRHKKQNLSSVSRYAAYLE